MVAMAPVLGSFMACVDNAQEKVSEVLCSAVDRYVREPHVSIRSDEPAIKALAIMEKHDTSYVFVVDDGHYKGIVTIQGIAAKMSELATCLVAESA
jgi:CBS domain-containing protein